MKHLTIAERTKKTEHCNLLTPQQLRNLISIVYYYKENLFERHQRENGLSATIKSTTDIINVLEDLNLSYELHHKKESSKVLAGNYQAKSKRKAVN